MTDVVGESYEEWPDCTSDEGHVIDAAPLTSPCESIACELCDARFVLCPTETLERLREADEA